MTDKERLMNELKEKFNKIQKELGFKSSYDEIERIFFISDSVLKAGFVSENFSRQLCSRIVEAYHSWLGYLHGLILPNTQNIININESKMFSQEEKKKIMNLMSKIIALTDRNGLVGLTKNKKEEAKFIDDSVELWNSLFERELKEVMQKVVDEWAREDKFN